MIRNLAQELYNYLKVKHPLLPPFSYQVGLQNNDCLIFTKARYNGVKYFDWNYYYASYVIRLYAPKMNHNQQWNLVSDLEATLTKLEGWAVTIKKEDFIVDTIHLSNYPSPDQRTVNFELESYNEVGQVYQLELELIMRKVF